MSVAAEIQTLIEQSFMPSHLQVINESDRHNVPKGSESHFKLIIASDAFVGKKLLQRHQQVNQLLADIIRDKIHALALHTYTTDEWQTKQQAPQSPNCLGGSKHERS